MTLQSLLEKREGGTANPLKRGYVVLYSNSKCLKANTQRIIVASTNWEVPRQVVTTGAESKKKRNMLLWRLDREGRVSNETQSGCHGLARGRQRKSSAGGVGPKQPVHGPSLVSLNILGSEQPAIEGRIHLVESEGHGEKRARYPG